MLETRETQEGNFDSNQELPHLVSLPRADHRPGEQTSAAGTQEISCGLTSSVPFILRGWNWQLGKEEDKQVVVGWVSFSGQ